MISLSKSIWCGDLGKESEKDDVTARVGENQNKAATAAAAAAALFGWEEIAQGRGW